MKASASCAPWIGESSSEDDATERSMAARAILVWLQPPHTRTESWSVTAANDRRVEAMLRTSDHWP
eukprot:8904560-Alexandrium_andersonii.AAC.1